MFWQKILHIRFTIKNLLSRWVWVFVTMFLSSFSFVYWVYFPFLDEGKVIVDGVWVEDVPLSGLTREEALHALHRSLPPLLDRPITLIDGDFKFICLPREWGFSLNYSAMIAEAFRLGHEGSILRQWKERKEIRRENKINRALLEGNKELLEQLIRLLKIQVDIEPVSADVVVDREGRVRSSPGRMGRRLNRQKFMTLLRRIVLSTRDRTLTLPVDRVEPALSDEEVTNWELTQVISFYNTKFDRAKEERTHNLRTAAVSLHGTLIPPGETFSFNTRVGPRIMERGYKEAPIVFENRLIPGVGGGVCQVSTTLYNSWLLAGFNVNKRFNHTLPVSYVEMGRDAAVVYGAQDLIFTNPLPTPVLISASMEDETLTVAVLGKKPNNTAKYSLETKITEVLPYPVLKVEDPTLKAGLEVVEEEGRKGFKVELWRVAWDQTGETERKMVGGSFYKPVPRLIKVGTKK